MSRSRAPALRQYNVNVGTFPHTRDSSLNFATARRQVATHVVPTSPPARRQCRAGNVAETLHRWPVTTRSHFPSPKLSTLPNVFLLSMGPQGQSPDNGSLEGTSRSHRGSAQVAATQGRRNYVPGDAACSLDVEGDRRRRSPPLQSRRAGCLAEGSGGALVEESELLPRQLAPRPLLLQCAAPYGLLHMRAAFCWMSWARSVGSNSRSVVCEDELGYSLDTTHRNSAWSSFP